MIPDWFKIVFLSLLLMFIKAGYKFIIKTDAEAMKLMFLKLNNLNDNSNF